MNLGLGNLTELKTHLLAPELVSDAAYDSVMAALGKGIAGRMEKFCDRQFGRVAAGTVEFSGDRCGFVLPRYPVETVTKIEQRDGYAGAWYELDLANTLAARNDAAGMIEFLSPPGLASSRVRVTWTGGFWFDESENASGTLPGGAAARPDDLYLSWLRQCAAVWAAHAKLGIPIAVKKEPAAAVQSVPLTDEVKETLFSYRRFQL